MDKNVHDLPAPMERAEPSTLTLQVQLGVIALGETQNSRRAGRPCIHVYTGAGEAFCRFAELRCFEFCRGWQNMKNENGQGL